MLQKTNPSLQFFYNQKPAAIPVATASDVHWAEEHQEGQLAVDVVEANGELVVTATLAGTRPEDISLHLHNDFLTIRGVRYPPAQTAEKVFINECFWGPFSRTIVLPTDIKSELAQSEYKNGVLTIRLPTAGPRGTIPIMVVEE